MKDESIMLQPVKRLGGLSMLKGTIEVVAVVVQFFLAIFTDRVVTKHCPECDGYLTSNDQRDSEGGYRWFCPQQRKYFRRQPGDRGG